MQNRSKTNFFEQTIWSTIIKVKFGDEEQRKAALERLLIRYRLPILRHIQASLSPECRTPENAEDLTQAFICQCLRLDFLKNVSPEHGRFRTFVKKCIQHFLRDQHVRDSAEIRGGGELPLSLEATDEERKPLLEPCAPEISLERTLDREWALCLLHQAMDELEKECINARRGQLFKALKGHLGRAPDPGTAKEIGERLGMAEGAVHTAMNRLRGRLGELISQHVRQTVGQEEDWKAELKYLIDLLGQG